MSESEGIASSEPADVQPRPRGLDRRALWTYVGAGAGLGVVLGIGIWALFLRGGDSVSAPSPTVVAPHALSPAPSAAASASIAPSAVAPPEMEVGGEGFPVFATSPSSSTPWTDIGPGWLAVPYKSTEGAAATVTLLSPDGEGYAALALADPRDVVLGWGARGLLVGRYSADSALNGEHLEGALYSVDPRTGAYSIVAADTPLSEVTETSPGGPYVMAVSGGDGKRYVVVDADGTVAEWEWAYGLSTLSPSGDALVSFYARADGRADVVALDPTRLAEPEVIDVFARPAFQYVTHGWLADDTVLVSRPVADDGEIRAYYTYDITNRSVADYTLPFSHPQGEIIYDHRAGLFAVTDRAGLTVYSRSGQERGHVPCDPAAVARVATATEGRLVVACDHFGSWRRELVVWEDGTGVAWRSGEHLFLGRETLWIVAAP